MEGEAMTPMQQAVHDMLLAQHTLSRLAAFAKNHLHPADSTAPRGTHEIWANAVRTQQRECRRNGMVLVALYPAANDEDGRGPVAG